MQPIQPDNGAGDSWAGIGGGVMMGGVRRRTPWPVSGTGLVSHDARAAGLFP